MLANKILMTGFLGTIGCDHLTKCNVSPRFDVPASGDETKGWVWNDGMAVEFRPFGATEKGHQDVNVFWTASGLVDPAVMLRRLSKQAGQFGAHNRDDDDTIEIPYLRLEEELIASWVQQWRISFWSAHSRNENYSCHDRNQKGIPTYEKNSSRLSSSSLCSLCLR